LDNLPTRWFEEPTTKGPLKGAKLNSEKYARLLEIYYARRGWDNRGIPTKEILTSLQLEEVAQELQNYIKLSD
jgi:aldehyde:ferredoxin oxidoreductase